jgi:hypothetical protein
MACRWAPPMIFIVKRASDQAFEEEREIDSVAALVKDSASPLAAAVRHCIKTGNREKLDSFTTLW